MFRFAVTDGKPNSGSLQEFQRLLGDSSYFNKEELKGGGEFLDHLFRLPFNSFLCLQEDGKWACGSRKRSCPCIRLIKITHYVFFVLMIVWNDRES